MFKAIGLNTKKVYAEGKYRNDCFRDIHKEYPYQMGKCGGVWNRKVLPEPLIIRRVNDEIVN